MSKPNERRKTNLDPRMPTTAALQPVMGAVFIAFLVIGMAMPVLPLHVHQGLGLGTFVVGLVAGSQFGAAIGFGTPALGRLADRAGLGSVFGASMLAAFGAAGTAAALLHQSRAPLRSGMLACP
jgi:MFS family permease